MKEREISHCGNYSLNIGREDYYKMIGGLYHINRQDINFFRRLRGFEIIKWGEIINLESIGVWFFIQLERYAESKLW